MRFLIAHAGWIADRSASTRRLLRSLDARPTSSEPCDVELIESRGREHASIWARRLWEAAADFSREDHVCLLNDDVILHHDFRAICEAMIEAVPDEPISLHTSAPAARDVAKWGFPWARCYHYTGPAVILPPGAAADLLDFAYKLPWSFLSRTNEDNVAIHWAWERQRPFWCAIPAPVTHDTKVPSSLGYDNHPNRTPTVPWEDFPDAAPTDPDYWRCSNGDLPPLVENLWAPTGLLDYARRVWRAGRNLCTICMSREAEVGTKDVGLCCQCIATLYATSIRGNNP